jgi:thiol-disulfide isomerase/thioredoxin
MDLTVQFSGGERDYIFCNREGRSFDDVSLVSGLDDPADARSIALLDLDRDGWVDVALANANTPQLRLFRNRQGDGSAGAPPPAIAVRFVGGRKDAGPGTAPDGGRWSARDGYGAQVRVDVGDGVLLREHRCGEGMASQNSATMLVGLGEGKAARGVSVKWPSGRSSEVGAVAAGSLVTVFEDPADNGGRPARIEPYRPTAALALNAASGARPRSGGPMLSAPSLPALADDGLVVYTSMATWCAVCKGELPQIARLRESFGADELELVAVPVDATDDEAKLARYVEANAPRYRLRSDLGRDPSFRAGFSGIVQMTTGLDGLPSSVVTDRAGRVLHAGTGVPTVSDLRRLRRTSF